MKKITLKTSAKINLTLDVTSIRDDGYHNIESIFQSIGIYDIITVSRNRGSEINISCSDLSVPCDKRNIVYKAAEKFFLYTGKSSGLNIDIQKNIPSQAGLGGGSSDGAAVLTALNLLFKTHLAPEALIKIGSEVSADTPFFINGGTALVEGIGDSIKPIRFIPPTDFVIAKGKDGISTPSAYKHIDMLFNPKHPKTEKLLKAIDKGKFINHCDLCGNLFEQVTDIDDVFEIKKKMIEMNALSSVMSGSGASVFGIFKNRNEAEHCAFELNRLFPFSTYCQSVGQSIKIISTN
ncbi:MAG: 4-(cytidine 5'-diphospho)-2-C-methyl-D-erythritol kinase [Oscillospiraceae bacterium]|nr:4-(cytidine 5'-diphospho)-2-C-methyl-D-erythritol kinase [Oscillospiraceae bacterium]